MISLLAIIILMAGTAFCQQTIKSKYFNVYLSDGIDKIELLKKLRADHFLHKNAAFFDVKAGGGTDSLIAETLDAVYIEVSDVLDIHLYSFSINLEILPDKGALSEELKPYFNQAMNAPSFYSYDNNRIYISFADMTLGMLSHEMTHAITTHYFVVQPPARLQEILSGYTEYSIRKRVKDLPPK